MTYSPEPGRSVVLFDGHCNLCSGAVQFILKRDKGAQFRFASLHSAVAKELLQTAGALTLPDSLVLVQDGAIAVKSNAALRIARRLRWPWPCCGAFWIVPRPLRDFVYDWIARHRYRWFGRRETCMVPTPALRGRFLDAGELH